MIATFLSDLLFLVYPEYCPACGQGLPPRGEVLCLTCTTELHMTGQHLLPENAFTQRFWGRLKLGSGAAMYSFIKDGRVQNLVHALKYEGRADVGSKFGLRFGALLSRSPHFSDVDCVVPVPLHRRKERKRGYNQSACWAEGLSRGMGKPCYPRALRRRHYTDTQTRKTRFERAENVQNAFEMNQPGRIAGRHVLLVDDVLTTGATLEACGALILDLEATRLSLATLAIAQL